MWRSRMFWQVFLSYGVLIVLSVGLLGFVVGSQVERNELREVEERLEGKAMLLREVIRGKDSRELYERLVKLSTQAIAMKSRCC